MPAATKNEIGIGLKNLAGVAKTMATLRDSIGDQDVHFAPAEYPTFASAAYVAGGNIVTVSKLYPIKEDALAEIANHDFFLFFDEGGEKLGEARVVVVDGVYRLVEA